MSTERIITELEVRADKALAGLKQVEKAADGAAKAVDKLADAEQQHATVTEHTSRKTVEFSKVMERVERTADPMAVKLRKLQSAQEMLNKAFERGAVDALRHADLMNKLQAQHTALSAAAGRSAATAGKMGGAMQQAGFQIGDFATQVASGQSAMVALTQQGTQLISMFGPWGAVLGVAARNHPPPDPFSSQNRARIQ